MFYYSAATSTVPFCLMSVDGLAKHLGYSKSLCEWWLEEPMRYRPS
jgi:hypothetical protein